MFRDRLQCGKAAQYRDTASKLYSFQCQGGMKLAHFAIALPLSEQVVRTCCELPNAIHVMDDISQPAI